VYAEVVIPAATQTASIRLSHQHLRDLIDPVANPAHMIRQVPSILPGDAQHRYAAFHSAPLRKRKGALQRR